jgi:hypothetical protein
MADGATYLVFLTPEAFNVTPGNLIHGIYHMALGFVCSCYELYNLPVSPRFAAVS